MEKIEFEVYRNKRKSPENFSMDFHCEGCNNYVEYLVYLCCEESEGLTLCKSCLTKAIEAIDKQYVEDMKKGE